MRRARAEDVAERAVRDAVRAARRLSPKSRHKALLDAHDAYFGPHGARNRGVALRDKPYDDTDEAALAREYRFVRDGEEDARREGEWAVRLAKRYADALYKTFCVCDLSRASERMGDGRARVGMRWRTEAEVRSGKGQLTCGERRCDETEGLRTYECHFRYAEHGETKSALVKVRVCRECAKKLGDESGFKRVDDGDRRRSRDEKKSKKRKRERDSSRDSFERLL